jgi:hypothetical protein
MPATAGMLAAARIPASVVTQQLQGRQQQQDNKSVSNVRKRHQQQQDMPHIMDASNSERQINNNEHQIGSKNINKKEKKKLVALHFSSHKDHAKFKNILFLNRKRQKFEPIHKEL